MRYHGYLNLDIWKKNREVEKNGFKIYFDSKSRYKHFMMIALNHVDIANFMTVLLRHPVFLVSILFTGNFINKL